MRTHILTSIFALTLASSVAFAQTPPPNPTRMTLHYKSGEVKTFDLTELDYMEFDNGGETPVDPPVPGEPKVGDYFYSDGTWSDGGLVSIDANGCNAVWAATKPAPIEGKTVIGIVFQTNPDRIAEADRLAGYTHGYVIACKNIQDPNKTNFAQYPETVWFTSGKTWVTSDANKVSKLAKSCYENLSGREETQKMFEKNDAQYYSEDIPMFYYGTTAYPVAAPENTSGWFIPSVGQMWDCVANFCSGEVAQYLDTQKDQTIDFTYYVKHEGTVDVPFDKFMSVFSLVPEADKDEITIPDGSEANKKYIAFGTSTRYDEESRVIINLGMEGYKYMEGMAEWFDGEAHARPILAF